jgi:nucleotide-binding universal stress UspA family protein
MAKHRTILHATGLSTDSRYALGVACTLARQTGCELALLHVMPQVRDQAHAMRCDQALDALAESVSGVRLRKMLLAGDVTDKILWAAREFRHDLIVLGRSKPSLISRFLGRGVSKEVRKRSPCPVLTVSAPPKWSADYARGCAASPNWTAALDAYAMFPATG